MNTTGRLTPGSDFILAEQMEQLHFPRPWTLAQWQEMATEVHQLYFWKHGEQTVGFALFGHVKGDETAHLLKICLDPKYRGKGEAEKFWNSLVIHLSTLSIGKVFLEVEESNVIARNFYKKVGFKIIRSVKEYYTGGESAVMMLLTL
ncbi:MAG TPA: GNAT family N-acetyltransferase [Bacteriovoracaceae bacterium]|nr:GNAT family N-acetyltransferase [Bacteriovoracaceae bacterium]